MQIQTRGLVHHRGEMKGAACQVGLANAEMTCRTNMTQYQSNMT